MLPHLRCYEGRFRTLRRLNIASIGGNSTSFPDLLRQVGECLFQKLDALEKLEVLESLEVLEALEVFEALGPLEKLELLEALAPLTTNYFIPSHACRGEQKRVCDPLTSNL